MLTVTGVIKNKYTKIESAAQSFDPQSVDQPKSPPMPNLQAIRQDALLQTRVVQRLKELTDTEKPGTKTKSLMPLFHQKIKPRSCRRPLIVDSRWENNKNGREYWVGTEVWD